MANTLRRTTPLPCSAPTNSPARLFKPGPTTVSRRLSGLERQSTLDRLDVDDLVLTRLSALPAKARPLEEETLAFLSTETAWEHELHGADKLYDEPTGDVFVVRSNAVLELAEGNSTMTVGSGTGWRNPGNRRTTRVVLDASNARSITVLIFGLE